MNRKATHQEITNAWVKALEQIEIDKLAIEQLQAELSWLDDHLFQNVDTQATREFCTEDTLEVKRLLRICDLIDAERTLKREE
jgi:hypothetical protein